MKTWFISDTHFNHLNIIRYSKRPFETLKEMNETLIKNWNERIKKNDIVYFLGDFCFVSGSKRGEGEPIKPKKILEQLNGNIIFIKGNHDPSNYIKTKNESIIIKTKKYRINLVHKPVFVNYNVDFNIVGHVHEKWKHKKFYKENNFFLKQEYTIAINCGVDVWNFRPVELSEILSLYEKLESAENEQEKIRE